MTEIPAENYSPTWADDSRAALPLVGDEREILTAIRRSMRTRSGRCRTTASTAAAPS
jgi:hypothetical protein